MPPPPPPLYYRDMFTFLPFQVNHHKFVCGVYVMSYDILKPPPPMEFKVKIKNVSKAFYSIKGPKVYYYDPILNKNIPIKIVKISPNSVTVILTAIQYPRLLIIKK
jgi:hypothetical protein